MIVRFIKIKELSTYKVGFYTLYLDEEELTEFEKFDGTDFTHHQEELKIIYYILKTMGLRGAKPYYFRPENGAEALPAKKDVPLRLIEANLDQGIRLYCIRITDKIVILLNGGIKTNQNPKLCSNVKRHFNIAWQLSAAITRAKLAGDIHWDSEGTELTPLEMQIDL
ncbi:MAG: hypothetical protein QM541_11525 [Flavobacterium sp.]|nr:hypothetical protein [Flavobacterium sp.]